MMKILDIYQKYSIPKNLQQHMFRVAAVGMQIAQNWKDKELINLNVIIHTLLLHDMGNIIKFDMQKAAFILPEEKDKIPYFQQVQREFKQKYGSVHGATNEIARELGAPEYILFLLDHMSSSQIKDIIKTSDWNNKICYYSDMRIMPKGVVSVRERFEDLGKRYKEKQFIDKTSFDTMMQSQDELARQLTSNVSISLDQITDRSIEPYMKQLEQYDIDFSKLT